MEDIVVVSLSLTGASGTLCARTHVLKGLKAGETMDFFQWSQGHGAQPGD